MSPLHLTQTKRREVIQENILTHELKELATLCGVSERTIKRDVRKWRQEGGFEQFLLDEFFKMYAWAKLNDPSKAFDRLCYLIGRTITTRQIQKTEVEGKIEITWKSPDDSPT